MARVVALAAAATLFSTLFAPSSAQNVVRDLGYANYSGVALSNGVSYWLGMHYAAPPTGNLRFAEPQPPIVYEGVTDATQVCAVWCGVVLDVVSWEISC